MAIITISRCTFSGGKALAECVADRWVILASAERRPFGRLSKNMEFQKKS
jgi:hypothetical protein